MDLFYALVGVVLLLLFVYHVYSIQFSTRKLPPGPFMAPFGLGVLPTAIHMDYSVLSHMLKTRPWEYLDKWSKKYGDLFSVQVGSFYTVVVSSYDIMHEIGQLDEYSIKFAHEALTYPRTFNKELGLIFAATPELWVEMRRFTQKTLREFGFGKRHTMQSAVEAETNELVKELKQVIEKQDGVLKIRTFFVLSVLNVLWCMVAGTRYEHDDPKLLKMMERNFAMTKSITFAEPLHIVFSTVKKLFPSVFQEDLRNRVYDECHQFTHSLVQEKKAEGMYKTQPQNYIDVFLQKIENTAGDENSLYTEQQLQAMLADLLQTGSTTTNGTLNYGLLFLILNPEVQKKCQQEIDSIVPRHLTPTIEDIEKMQYFQAFVLETHRLANIVPNPIPRIVPRDWKLRGYTIPKGTVILSNHYSVFMDEKIWGDPHNFRPERFLNENGEYRLDKRMIHFGIGKRICVGITLANSVIPIFLATLLQNFIFSVVPGTEPPTTEPEIGVSLSPMEFPIHVENRPVLGSRQPVNG